MRRKSALSQLVVKNLEVSIKTTHILHCVNTMAKSGELLAIMGPSGSGKTTLLNAIAGRVSVTSGEITLDGNHFNKQLRRRMGYVLQDDIFMSRLTVYETLYFTAMIHIPEKVTWKEKQGCIREIVDALDLSKCLHTVIGDIFNRGLSGGERKRVNIACELLTDPDIMLIDEPTSGLDSSTAHILMSQLRTYATDYNKTIIAAIHQPSSQVYHMFSTLLLLMNGRVTYFGKASEALDYFEDIGLQCAVYFNPADFLLALMKSDDDTRKKILDAAENNKRKFENSLQHSVAANGNYYHFNNACFNTSDPDVSILSFKTSESSKSIIDVYAADTDCVARLSKDRQNWSTSFWTQYKMLTWRQFKQSRGHIFAKVDIMRSIFIAVITGIIYFETDHSFKMLRDRMGIAFVCATHWGFDCILQTVSSFPAERGVIRKERNAGAYRLSAYYFAKMTSDLPLILVVPVIFLSIVYWMSAMGDGILFCSFIGINLLNCLIAQAIGYILGSGIADFKLAITSGTSFMLFSILLCGFYNAHLPHWIQWAKYLSLVHYPYASVNILNTQGLPILWCNATSVELFPACGGNTTYITRQEILRDFAIDIPYNCYISTMSIVLVVLRTLAYFVLKWKE